MNLAYIRERYTYYTTTASTIVRNLGFAGIAITWLFKIESATKQSLPHELIPAIYWIILALGLDLLHYVFGSIVWGCYNRYKEKQNTTEEKDFEAPRQINWPANLFFWTKILALIIGYLYLLCFLRNILL